jgi:peptidoglycan L-alanyl-D-glutamate endopeptidase CwlK
VINSRKLEDLNPRTEQKARRFIETCEREGIDVIITSTLRDKESQDALYAQGRTAPGPVVTKVKGGFSFHNYGVAFDFVPIVSGKAIWNDGALWEKCGRIGEECGLEWGGRWTRMVDKPHFQDTTGLTIADYLAGKMVTA